MADGQWTKMGLVDGQAGGAEGSRNPIDYNDALLGQLAEAQTKISEQDKEIKYLKQCCDTAGMDLARAHQEISALQRQLHEAYAYQQQTGASYQALAAETMELRKDNASWEKYTQNLREQIESLNSILNKLRAKEKAQVPKMKYRMPINSSSSGPGARQKQSHTNGNGQSPYDASPSPYDPQPTGPTNVSSPPRSGEYSGGRGGYGGRGRGRGGGRGNGYGGRATSWSFPVRVGGYRNERKKESPTRKNGSPANSTGSSGKKEEDGANFDASSSSANDNVGDLGAGISSLNVTN